MTLAREVAAQQERRHADDRKHAEERRVKTLEDAAAKFRGYFLEDADCVELYGREIENARARDWPDRVPVVITHDGIRFAYKNDDHGRPELCVILTCQTCGRDYLGEAVYGIGEDVRKSAVEHLSRALEPAAWRAHECEENVLRPVRGAIKSAAQTLRVTEREVVDKTQRMA